MGGLRSALGDVTNNEAFPGYVARARSVLKYRHGVTGLAQLGSVDAPDDACAKHKDPQARPPFSVCAGARVPRVHGLRIDSMRSSFMASN